MNKTVFKHQIFTQHREWFGFLFNQYWSKFSKNSFHVRIIITQKSPISYGKRKKNNFNDKMSAIEEHYRENASSDFDWLPSKRIEEITTIFFKLWFVSNLTTNVTNKRQKMVHTDKCMSQTAVSWFWLCKKCYKHKWKRRIISLSTSQFSRNECDLLCL